MAIKMRVNVKEAAICCECKQTQQQVLDMFDVCVGNTILTICDCCTETLFKKTLSANCHTNHRVKSQRDLTVLQHRDRRRASNELLKQSKQANA